MKATTRLLVIAPAVALLASCASMDDRASVAPASGVVNDAAYIAAVERMAVARGVRVQWVNPPKVRVEED